jgi:hypothetical protein
MIKFHEIVGNGRYVTTIGLSRPAYDAMNSTAHRAGIPLTGHAPNNLGLEGRPGRSPELSPFRDPCCCVFRPEIIVARLLLPSLFALGVVLLAALGMVVITAVFRSLKQPSPFRSQWRSTIVLALSFVFVPLWPGFLFSSQSSPY